MNLGVSEQDIIVNSSAHSIVSRTSRSPARKAEKKNPDVPDSSRIERKNEVGNPGGSISSLCMSEESEFADQTWVYGTVKSSNSPRGKPNALLLQLLPLLLSST